MKKTLSFSGDESDESTFRLIQSASPLYCTIHDLLEWLRNMRKYQDQETVPVADVEQKVWDLLQENGINWESLG